MLPAEMPRLSDGRVELREFDLQDVPLVQSVATDDLIPLITTVPTSGTREDAASFIARQRSRLADGLGYSFAIADIDSNQAVGQIGLWLRNIDVGRASIGY